MTGGPTLSPRLERLKRWYVGAAIHTFNLLLTFTALNVALGVWIKLRPAQAGAYNPPGFPRDKLAAAYGDLPMDVVQETLRETWNQMKLEAKPWVHYGEAEFSGKYVNVSKDGVRSNGPRARRAPPAGKPFRVFTFGGSTMWGYGVPDGETIAAHLERTLEARHPNRAIDVRNYGRGYYGTSQEAALLASLLRRGEAPDAVVFLDGLNEATAAYTDDDLPHFDEPAKMASLRAMWEARDESARARPLPAWLPLVQMIDRVKLRREHARQGATSAAQDPAAAIARGREDAEVLLRMYLRNRRLIELAATDAGIAPYFFWQPIPVHAYDLRKHLFALFYGPREAAAMRALYEMFPARQGPVVDLSGMLEHHDEPAYIDAHHYAPTVCRLIAEKMADRIVVPDAG